MKPLLHGLTIGLSAFGLACAAHAQTKQNDSPLPPNVASQPAPTLPTTEAQAKELVLRDGYTDVGTLRVQTACGGARPSAAIRRCA